jgi:hypothetical protein
MSEINLKCAIKRLYEFFSSSLYKKHLYVFNETDTSRKHTETFLKLLDKKYSLQCIGQDFLINYFFFQFNYWSKLEIQSFNKKVNLSFVIGKKALDRYILRDVSFDLHIRNHFCKEFKIKVSEIKNTLSDCYGSTNYKNTSEEIERKRYYATYEGFLNCIRMTTLYNPKSLSCITCKFKKDCLEIQKSTLPKIYKHRNATIVR